MIIFMNGNKIFETLIVDNVNFGIVGKFYDEGYETLPIREGGGV